VIGLSCHHRRPQCASIAVRLISASRYQDHTTSPSACRCIRLTHHKRPSLPAPNVRDDRETPLFIERRMTAILPVILGDDQPRGLRPINTTGKSGATAKMLSSDEQLLECAGTCPGRGAAPSARLRASSMRYGAAPQSREEDEAQCENNGPRISSAPRRFAAHCAAPGERRRP